MLKYIKRFSLKTGVPPGTPIHTGEIKVEDVTVTIFKYNNETYKEEQISVGEENIREGINKILNSPLLNEISDNSFNYWIDVKGIHNIDLVRELTVKFDIHNLSLEDILNTGIRPKIEDFEDYLFFVLNSFEIDKNNYDIHSEQVSIVLQQNCVISFQEGGAVLFKDIKERIRNKKGRVRKKGADYLAHTILDVIVDNYFWIFEYLAEEIENIEEEILNEPDQSTLQKIHRFKRDVLILRKSIWPLREMMRSLNPDETHLIEDSTEPYFRNVNDHIVQIIDIIESITEMLTSMHDMYMSYVSNKMNEVMKVLTIIATIFIPLTFLAGIYGMNFRYMPELNWRWGYFIILGLMAIIGAVMVIYFKRKKWF